MKLLILLVVCAVPFAAYQAQSAGSESSRAHHAEKRTNQTNNGLNSPVPSPIQKAPNNPKAENPNQTVTSNSSSDSPRWVEFVNAFSTLVVAIFTALLFIGVIAQIRTSKSIERAWVMAEIRHDSDKWADRKPHVLEGSGTEGESTAIYAVLVCANAGKTPAWIEETVAKFEMVKSLPNKPNFKSAKYIERSTIPLGMAEGGALPHTQEIPWVPVAEGHQRVDEMAVIYGRVTYRDIFGKKHRTTFGYKIRPRGRLERLEGHPKYNHST
jgi:hypothetical protein